MYLLLAGVLMLVFAVSLFWLKDRLQSPILARFAYSGLVARLALAGAALCILGALLAIARLFGKG
ncbi:MAG: hypothetical protein AB7U38_12675 [Hyphomicrobiales bacterium]